MVYTVLLTWLVMSLTILFRNQTFALVAHVPLADGDRDPDQGRSSCFPVFKTTASMTRFLPFNAGGRIMQRSPGGATTSSATPSTPVGGFIVFGLFTALLMALA